MQYDPFNAFITLASDVTPAGPASGRLAGIPVALKDNISTSDMPTTCASDMLRGMLMDAPVHSNPFSVSV